MKRILEVQKEIGSLSKSSKNPFFKSAYLDLNDLLTHVMPLLHKQGLILLQPIQEGKVWSTIYDAKTNDLVAGSSIELPPITDPQKMGSAITYYRRYTLKSLLAIAEKDDDGNGASQQPVKEEPKPTKKSVTKIIEEATDAATLNSWYEWIKKFDLVDIATEKSNELKTK
jgi:hypothetical protein